MRLEGGLDVRIPSPVLNLLLQSLHILKHALGWGIGLRQLCDMARSCYKLHDEVESEEMKRLHYNWEWTDGSSCYMHFWWNIWDFQWRIFLIRRSLQIHPLYLILSGGAEILACMFPDISGSHNRFWPANGRRHVLFSVIFVLHFVMRPKKVFGYFPVC